MGTIQSIGKVLSSDLEKVDFNNIKLMSTVTSKKKNYSRFIEQALNDQSFWNQTGMEKKILNVEEPHLREMNMDDELLARLKYEITRASHFDRQVFEAEDEAYRKYFSNSEKLHKYRTFDVNITTALLFCPSLLELAIQNCPNSDLLVLADSITVEPGEMPLGVHNSFNHEVRDNFCGATEWASETNFHFNLNTGSNHENQSPFVVWLGAEEKVATPRHMVKYIIDNGLVDEHNKQILLENLFIAENCWEPVTDKSLSKAVVLNILGPLYYKAKYCTDNKDGLEGIYAISEPHEALCFNPGMIHSTNYFPPASEQRISAIIRTVELQHILNPDIMNCYTPGSANSGVDMETKSKFIQDKDERMNKVYNKIFGYEGEGIYNLKAVLIKDPESIARLKDHYRKSAAFFDQEKFTLSDDARQALKDFFEQEAKLSYEE